MNAPAARSTSLAARALPGAFVLLWSTGFLGAKLGLPHAPPFTFLMLRFAVVIASLLVLAVALRAPWPVSLRDAGRVAVVGVLLHGVYLGGVFVAISLRMPAGLSALIVGLQPLLTAAIAAPLFGERLSRLGWLGLALGLAGVFCVVGGKIGTTAASPASFAAAAAALCGITAGTLLQKRHGARMNLITGSIIQFAAAAAALGPLALALEDRPVEWTGEFVFALGWLSFVLSIGAITLLHLLIRRGAAAKVATLFYLTPSVTAVFAYFLFGETLGPLAIAGFALTAIGVALVTRRG